MSQRRLRISLARSPRSVFPNDGGSVGASDDCKPIDDEFGDVTSRNVVERQLSLERQVVNLLAFQGQLYDLVVRSVDKRVIARLRWETGIRIRDKGRPIIACRP